MSPVPDLPAASPAPAARSWTALRSAWRRTRSAQVIVIVLSAWITVAGNVTLWRTLVTIEPGLPGVLLCLLCAAIVFAGTIAMLSVFGWSRWAKPAWLLVILAAAVSQYYMLEFGVVIDHTMMGNIAQTDVSEVRDLLTWSLLANVLLVAALPTLWLWQVPVARGPQWRSARRTVLLFVASLAITAALIGATYRTMAPLVRNNMQLRYLANPAMPVASLFKAVTRSLFKPSRKLVSITAGAALGATHAAGARPPLIVVMVGETARADHFALNGYPRPTTPELAARNVLSFHDAWSCGTNTMASVPCMFSSLGKEGYTQRKAEHENLLDVAEAAGMAVLWVDNQAGCKTVCDRVPSASTEDLAKTPEGKALCSEGECLDEALLVGLDRRIEALPAERRKNGILLVMHMMGSHGPAYARRSPESSKRFRPECVSSVLGECDRAQLINSYDNTIVYTDLVLAHMIDWLKTHAAASDTALLYMSDHGESLGEYGIFLHGLPYAFAPDVQKHVPMVLWLGEAMASRDGVADACLRGRLDERLSHDNLYHSVLGLIDVSTPTYQPQLDVIEACRKGREAGAARTPARVPPA